jgi:hypothetical protein
MDILRSYIDKFEKLDGGKYEKFFDKSTDIYGFLKDNLPKFSCSDKALEEIYYFRAYTFAKHLKVNRYNQVILTEWLDTESWQKETDGAISCPVGHHISELKWLKNGKQIARDYINFWVNDPEDLYYYNNWFIYAVYDYASQSGDMDFAYSIVDKLTAYFELFESRHKANCGIYKGVDNYDGMELSISGYGLRPTINSYVYASAYALSKIYAHGGEKEKAEKYARFAEDLRKQINEKLFVGDFYYNRPLEEGEEMKRYIPNFSNPTPDYDIKEEIGYTPFYFGIPEEKHNIAWKYLMDEKVFLAPYGITTADMSHPLFKFDFNHMCLWNGPVWPFATSQTLTGLAKTIRKNEKMPIGKKEYCQLLQQYAQSQYITIDGVKRPWIDEDLDGETGAWIARDWMYERDLPYKDRGVDYNHSSFIDLVLGGLVGAFVQDGETKFCPMSTGIEFSVEGLYINGNTYDLAFDGTTLQVR